MSTVGKLKAGSIFYAGEDVVTPYTFIENPTQSCQGYIKRDQAYYCDVKTLHIDHMLVSYRFFGSWVESIVKYKDLAFSPEEIIARIKPVLPATKPKPPVKQRFSVPPTMTELKGAVRLMNALCDVVPNGLFRLRDALTFALLDLNMYCRFGHKSKSFENALAFAQSIPPFEDLKSDECTHWMLNDQEHLKYM